jgi:hypothetical protein
MNVSMHCHAVENQHFALSGDLVPPGQNEWENG